MKWYKVKVYFPDAPYAPAEIYHDEIRGKSPQDAAARAVWNWPDAEWVEVQR